MNTPNNNLVHVSHTLETVNDFGTIVFFEEYRKAGSESMAGE